MTTAVYRSPAFLGAFWMVLAGVVYAAGNVLLQQLTMNMGFSASSVAFWQYGIAFLFSLPYLWRTGLSVMKTDYPWHHVVRVAFSALGVQAWAIGLASVPISQAIALVMTSPFFIIVGAWLFLGERVGPARWLATAVGFTGAVLILQPWSETFTLAAFLPIISALLWGATSLITKKLTAHERSESITVWLLMLLTPINALVAVGGGFAFPVGAAIPVVIVLGLTTVLAQYFLTRAYSSADAAYVQPFDDLKLPLNVIGGWLVFGYAPSSLFWVGGLMIVGASLTIMFFERRREV